MDKYIRGISKNARFFIADTTELVKRAGEIHDCNGDALALFGKFLTAGIFMGATLKGKDILTLSTQTDGLVPKMAVTADSYGNIKGYLKIFQGNEDEHSEFLGDGTLSVIKDIGLKEPYVGISEMKNNDLAKDIAYYYFTSEQTPTVISLGVSFGLDGQVEFAGGFMVQLFPEADENFIESLEKKISMIIGFTELRKGGMTLERIANLLYEDTESTENEKLV
ncbi:MAG: Hsp33 family molecular chaperone HslO, partial [Fusobacteriaceae bacterium]